MADIVQRYNDEDRIKSIPQKGQPRKLNDRDKRIILKKIKVNSNLSAPKLTSELFQEEAHADTIRRVLKEAGYNGRVARKKPYINETNRKKRLIFLNQYVRKEETWWNNVIFTHKNKLVWRK